MSSINSAIELTSSGDTNEYGAVVWFGTFSDRTAKIKMHQLAALIAKSNITFKDFKKFEKMVKHAEAKERAYYAKRKAEGIKANDARKT